MTILMRVRGTLSGFSGAPGLTTSYFLGTQPPTAAECLEAASRVRSCWNGMSARLPTGVSVQVNPQVDWIQDTDGSLVGSTVVAAPAVVNGASAGARQPTSSMLVGQLFTSTVVNGRRLRGRMFIGPIQASDVDGASGNVSAAAITAYTASLGVLGTQIATPITHRVWGRPKPAGIGLNAAVTQYGIAPKVGVLRSRRD